MTTDKDKARAEIDRLFATETKMIDRLAEVRRRVKEMGTELADAALAEGLDGSAADFGKAARKRDDLRAEAEAIDAAIDRVREQRAAEIPRVWRAESQELRVEAAKLAAEAEKHRQRADRMRAELAKHEGVNFQPIAVLPAMMLMGLDESTMSRFSAMHLRIYKLQQRAGVLEGQQVRRDGVADAPDVEMLIDALRADACTITPRADAARAWAEAALSRNPGAAVVNGLHLLWADGRIKEAESKVALRQQPVERWAGDQTFGVPPKSAPMPATKTVVPDLDSMRREMAGAATPSNGSA
jgi:hypothetical protein